MKTVIKAAVFAFSGALAGQADAAQSCTQTMHQIKDHSQEILETVEKPGNDTLTFLIVRPVVQHAASWNEQQMEEFCSRPDNARALSYVQPYLDKAKEAVMSGLKLMP